MRSNVVVMLHKENNDTGDISISKGDSDSNVDDDETQFSRPSECKRGGIFALGLGSGVLGADGTGSVERTLKADTWIARRRRRKKRCGYRKGERGRKEKLKTGAFIRTDDDFFFLMWLNRLENLPGFLFWPVHVRKKKKTSFPTSGYPRFLPSPSVD